MPSSHIIYLDYAATAPLDTAVLEKMLPFFGGEYGNPSSLHSSGRRAARAIAEARAAVAATLGASPDEIIFTGSGTESDNLAILGAARANKEKGNHVIVSAIEHKAVIEAARELEKEGFCVTYLPVDRFGRVSVEEYARAVTPKTILVSVMYANNEIGTIEPVRELAAALKKLPNPPLLHTDACQAVGFLPIGVTELGIDLMTLNGSKIYGPKGVGVLFKKRNVRLSPVIVGGEQEMNLRAGTESVPLIVGFAEALRLAEESRANGRDLPAITHLRDSFIKRLKAEIPDLVLNGHPENRLPNNVHVSIPYVEGESMLLMLDTEGIEASTGSACSAHDLQPSHVLLALGQSPELIHGSLRFSLGKYTEQSDIDAVMKVFPGIVRTLKGMSALTAKV